MKTLEEIFKKIDGRDTIRTSENYVTNEYYIEIKKDV